MDRDYTKRSEIEIVIREMGDQVATRLRHANAKAQVISLWIGFSMGYVDEEGKSSFSQQMKVPPTHSSKEIIAILLRIFENHYTNQHVRNVGVNTGNLIYTDALQLDLFSEPEEQVKDVKVDQVVDTIRQKYGFKSVVRAVSVMEGGRAIARSSLVGGHAGGMGGLEEGENHGKKNT